MFCLKMLNIFGRIINKWLALTLLTFKAESLLSIGQIVSFPIAVWCQIDSAIVVEK